MAKIAAVALGVVGVLGDDRAKYDEWKAAFGSNGGDEEFEVFSNNLRIIESMQENDSSATYSHLTPFANISPETFRGRMGYLQSSIATKQAPLLDVSNLAGEYDWRSLGAVNGIKDQGQCGSCWSFSTVANIEGAGFVETGKLLNLSEQQLVDCDSSDGGCRGGLPSNAFEWMIGTGTGLVSESDYPYSAKGTHCKVDASQEKAFISAWHQISTDETQIAAALQQYGPLSIGINADTFQFYSGGVMDPASCNPAALDHGVAIVGFGTDNGQDYWTVRNSWGTSWGEAGYIRIARGKGTCGLNSDVTTATGITTGLAKKEEAVEITLPWLTEGCSNKGHCGLAYQTCCLGFQLDGYPCGCKLGDGGSGLSKGDCGDCGAAYTLCCAGYAADGFPCTCDVTDGTAVV